MSHTDFITFALSMFFLIRGASRGFILTALVPVSIILSTLISILYYMITEDEVIGCLIALIFPVLFYYLFKHLIKKLIEATNRQIRPSVWSRLGGSIFNLTWGWIFISFALILLSVLPPWGNKMTAFRNDVRESASFYCVAQPIAKNIFNAVTAKDPTLRKEVTPYIFPSSPSKDSAIALDATNPDVKSLTEDPRFKVLLEDPEIQKEIEAHDFVTLMSNPKIINLTQQIIRDPATLRKVMALYTNQSDIKAPHWAPSPSSDY